MYTHSQREIDEPARPGVHHSDEPHGPNALFACLAWHHEHTDLTLA